MRLHLRRLGIDTSQQNVAYLRDGTDVARCEGSEVLARLRICHAGQQSRFITAALNLVYTPLLAMDEIGLSESAWRALGCVEGDAVVVAHAPPPLSFSAIRSKTVGRPLDCEAAVGIVADIAAGRYAEIELASLVSACSGNRLDEAETYALASAMLGAGQRLPWAAALVADKHCVGGLPGNRTTLLVVPIVAACGLLIPKISPRVMASPAGTADVMETLAPVALEMAAMRRVAEGEGGCIVRDGAIRVSPVDDLLVRVEQPLGLDTDGLLAASILARQAASGATHLLIDIPVGRSAKVRSMESAARLAQRLVNVGRRLGLAVCIEMTDGAQPVGCGVGPALEALDVLAVLQDQAGAPEDLRKRALLLAGYLLELCGKATTGKGLALASDALASGAAWRKFQRICEAQGGNADPAARTLYPCTLRRPCGTGGGGR